MNKAKEISTLWKQIKPQIGELVGLCCEVEDHAEVTADAYQRGYENGFIAGHLKAEKSGQSFYEDGYQRGLNDAWEAARKIGNMPYGEEEKVFGSGGWAFIEKHTASEAIEKIRQYEQGKEEQIQVGDEIKSGNERYVVLQKYLNNIDEYMAVLFNRRDGEISVFHLYNGNGAIFEKTGRHFPEIAEVLQKMKESDNG